MGLRPAQEFSGGFFRLFPIGHRNSTASGHDNQDLPMMDCKWCSADDFSQQVHYGALKFGFLFWAIIADDHTFIMTIAAGTTRTATQISHSHKVLVPSQSFNPKSLAFLETETRTSSRAVGPDLPELPRRSERVPALQTHFGSGVNLKYHDDTKAFDSDTRI